MAALISRKDNSQDTGWRLKDGEGVAAKDVLKFLLEKRIEPKMDVHMKKESERWR